MADSLTAQAVCCGQGSFLLQSVLIAAATSQERITDVQKLLDDATGAQVEVFDASDGTPSVAELQAFDAVLVFSDEPFADAGALGTNLADYWDAGGRVVVAVYTTAVFPLQGRWASGGYQLIQPTGVLGPREAAALNITEPNSPLVAGVTSLTAVAAFRSTGGVIVTSPPGGVVVATWGSGAPLIVRGVKGDRNLVALNFYPVSSRVDPDFWNITTDGAAILRNALLF